MRCSLVASSAGQGSSRQCAVSVAARHQHARTKSSVVKRRVKKRDIRTSFIRTPVAPELLPPPPATSTTSSTAAAPQQQPLTIPLIPPPGAVSSVLLANNAAAYQVNPPVTVSLGEACRSSSRGRSEAVVALAAVAAPEAPASPSSAEGFSFPAQKAAFEDSSSSSVLSASDSVGLQWGSNLNPDPFGGSLAALDRVLDGLLVAPTHTNTSSSSSSSSSSSPKGSSKGKHNPALHSADAQAAAGSASISSSSNPSSQKTKKSSKKSSSSGAAAPAVMTIQCESDWERELAAAAAHQQLLVVKVEGRRNQLLRGAQDPTLRFQTHTSLPTALNTYMPHGDLRSSSDRYSSYRSALSWSGSPDSSYSSVNSFEDPFFQPSSSQGLGNGFSCSLSTSGSSAGPSTLDSPLHHWYQELAGKYAAGSPGHSSSLKFLSLQSDGPRAKALCRRLGVSDCLSVLVVEPSSGRKVLEVSGTKIEQELPSGLLYHGDVDTEGRKPSELLPPISSKAELEAHKAKSDVSVVAYHMHAAPPCIKTYSALYNAAQTHSGSVACAVIDVDSNPECSAVSSELSLARLPTYIVYKAGQEVQRLSSTSERRRLAEVVQQVLSGPAVEAAAA